MSATKRRIRATLAVLALAGLAGTATAQGDAAAAEQLYKAGKALAKQGKYDVACPKFEESYNLDKGLGTLVNLADCHEHVGKIATAWAEWNEAVDYARREKDDRGKYAAERRDKLEPRLPKLSIDVANPVAALSVFRGDVVVGSASFGTPLAVDPGTVTVSVRRGDKVLKSVDVEAKEGETAHTALDLGAIDREFPEEKPAPPPTATATAPPAPTPAPPPPPPPSNGQKTLGFVVGGVGLAALVTAGAFELVALSKKSKADEPDQCVNNYCSPNGFSTIDSAKKYATIGQWVGVGGVLLTAVGATLVFTAPSSEGRRGPDARRVRVTATGFVAPGGGGLSVAGSL
jgi:hypothetical protein